MREHEDKYIRRADDFFKPYAAICNRIEILQREYDYTNSMIDAISGAQDDVPRGNEIGDRTGRYAAKLAEYSEKIEMLRKEALDKRMEISNFALELDDVVYGNILSWYYIDLMSVNEIAEAMSRNWRTAWNTLQRARHYAGEIIENAD